MKVLFLGGPGHTNRLDVTPIGSRFDAENLPKQVSIPLPSRVEWTADEPPESLQMERVTYELTWLNRYDRSGFGPFHSQLPVYIAPGYDGPPKACDRWVCRYCERAQHSQCESLTCLCEHVPLAPVAEMLELAAINTHPLDSVRGTLAQMMMSATLVDGIEPRTAVADAFKDLRVFPDEPNNALTLFAQCNCECPPTLHADYGCKNCACVRNVATLTAKIRLD